MQPSRICAGRCVYSPIPTRLLFPRVSVRASVSISVSVRSANLSDTYFTNRQDRYVLIRNKELADFYQSLMVQIEKLPFCHTVTKGGPPPAPVAVSSARPIPFGSGGDESDWSQRVAWGQSVSRLFTPDKTTADTPVPPPQKQPSTTDTFLFPTLQMVVHNSPPRISLHTSVQVDLHGSRLTSVCAPPCLPCVCVCVVVVQGSLFVTHDQRMTAGLFSLASSARFQGGRPARGLDVATGYMNLTHDYQTLLVDAKTRVRVLAAAEDANGWFGAKGAGRFVPQLYEAAA